MTSVVLLLIALWTFSPYSVGAVGTAADAMCVPVIPVCGCGMVMGPKGCEAGVNKFMCPCFDVTSGFTTSGVCVANFNCKGNSTSDGKSLGDLKGIMDLAKSLMDLLKQNGGGGGGGGQGQNPLADLYPPCTTNPATGTVSPIPCKNPDGSINYGGGTNTGLLGGTNLSSNVSETLLDALGKTSDVIDETGSDTETGTDTKTDSDTKTGTDTDTGEESGTGEEKVPENAATLKSVSKGDILIGEGGVTIVGSSRDGDTETASFFGSDARSRLQSASIIGRLCAARPWAGSFLSAVIPPGFFDGLCRIGGYQVGIVQLQPGTGGKAGPKTFTAPADMPSYVPAPDTGAPSVDIWAEPDRVRLGTRTYIFWTSRNVESCKVSGPSFHHTTLSGGASTVTITDTTVYTIKCKGLDGTEATDSVTVELAI